MVIGLRWLAILALAARFEFRSYGPDCSRGRLARPTASNGRTHDFSRALSEALIVSGA